MKLKDKVVLITGGGSGLGREMGLTFAREGAKIGVNDIRPESASNVVTEIERAGGKARPFVADVSSSAAVKKMFTDFVAAFGTIDILINNAGIGRTHDSSEVIPTHEKTDEDWHKMLSTHLDSAIELTKKFIEQSPEDILAFTNLSMFYQKKGMIQEAEAAGAEARRLDWKRQLKEGKK